MSIKQPIEPGEEVYACEHVVETQRFNVVYSGCDRTPLKKVLCNACDSVWSEKRELPFYVIAVGWCAADRSGERPPYLVRRARHGAPS